MKKAIVPLALGFGVTLAFIVGQRMSTDAMAVVIGVAVGVAASVPTSVLLVALLRRERREGWSQDSRSWQQPTLPQPPVIVLNPADLLGQRNQQLPLPPPPSEPMLEAGLRRLRVVGDDEDWG
jgi:hypothetical protein